MFSCDWPRPRSQLEVIKCSSKEFDITIKINFNIKLISLAVMRTSEIFLETPSPGLAIKKLTRRIIMW